MSQYERDQAQTLRMMVSSSAFIAPSPAPAKEDAPTPERDSEPGTPWTVPHRIIVVAGGRASVGTTTVARNLAASAALGGIRALYVEPDGTTAPRGVTDFYLLDAGVSSDFEGLADYIVLVTTPDAEAVRGAYLALKRLRHSDPDLAAGLVVNRAGSPEEGAALGERIASAARAFIRGPELDVLGWVLDDAEASRAGMNDRPLVAANPRSAAAAGIRLCVRRLWSRWRRGFRLVAA